MIADFSLLDPFFTKNKLFKIFFNKTQVIHPVFNVYIVNFTIVDDTRENSHCNRFPQFMVNTMVQISTLHVKVFVSYNHFSKHL